MQTVVTILSVLLGLAFLGAGGSKLAGVQQQVEVFNHLGYPQWFRQVTGVIEVGAAILLLLGTFVESLSILAPIGAALIVATMIGAVVSHIRASDAPQQMAPAAVLGIIGLVVLAFSSGVIAV